MVMPVYERTIYIGELTRELEEKQKAHKAAERKAKSKR